MNVLFVFVTALIMYYKQISEGYEDQSRFCHYAENRHDKSRNQKEHPFPDAHSILTAPAGGRCTFCIHIEYHLYFAELLRRGQPAASKPGDALMLSYLCGHLLRSVCADLPDIL